jgi:hypothetical protein
LAGRESEELDESVEDIDPRLLYSRHSAGRRHLSDLIARHEVLRGRDRMYAEPSARGPGTVVAIRSAAGVHADTA